MGRKYDFTFTEPNYEPEAAQETETKAAQEIAAHEMVVEEMPEVFSVIYTNGCFWSTKGIIPFFSENVWNEIMAQIPS